MVRTQIQLTEEQACALKALAAQRGVSLAELVRQGVERVLADDERRRKRQRALEALQAIWERGEFRGPPDLSTNHDKYLAEDFL